MHYTYLIIAVLALILLIVWVRTIRESRSINAAMVAEEKRNERAHEIKERLKANYPVTQIGDLVCKIDPDLKTLTLSGHRSSVSFELDQAGDKWFMYAYNDDRERVLLPKEMFERYVIELRHFSGQLWAKAYAHAQDSPPEIADKPIRPTGGGFGGGGGGTGGS